jgi:aryl-alcohol dehydrogenase-like predicted oxidoreductase
MAFIPWAPLDSGRHTRQSSAVLERVAERHAVGIGSVAIAWLLHHSKTMLPIPGTGSVQHLEENVAAAALRLTSEDVHELG